MTEKNLQANGGGLRGQKRVPPLVYVRYLDHVLFKDMDPAAYSNPFTRETIGWLAGENERAIQVVWERQIGGGATRQKATGLVILKSDIIERKFLNDKEEGKHDVYK